MRIAVLILLVALAGCTHEPIDRAEYLALREEIKHQVIVPCGWEILARFPKLLEVIEDEQDLLVMLENYGDTDATYEKTIKLVRGQPKDVREVMYAVHKKACIIEGTGRPSLYD